MIGVLSAVAPVVVMLGIGMIARRTGLMGREGVNALKSLVVNVTLPAVLISAFATAQYSAGSLVIPLAMFALCALGYVLGRLAARVFGLKSRFAPFLMTGYEAGMLGYALFALITDGKDMGVFAVLDIGHVLFVFTLYKALILGSGAQKPEGKALLKSLFTSPTVLAIFLGVLIGATGLYKWLGAIGASGVFDAVLDFVAAPTGAVILVTIGYDLVFSEIRWKDSLKTVGARLIVSAALCAVMLPVAHRFIGAGAAVTAAALLMFLLPPPYVLPVMADDPDQRAYVASTLSVATLVTIVAFAVLAAIF